MKVEIQSDAVDDRSGKIRRGDRAGEDYRIRQQEAWLHNGRAYPERFVIDLGDQPAFPRGFYEIAPASLEVGEYGRLQFGRRLQLLKLADEKPANVKAA
jgi:hypothetical protein